MEIYQLTKDLNINGIDFPKDYVFTLNDKKDFEMIKPEIKAFLLNVTNKMMEEYKCKILPSRLGEYKQDNSDTWWKHQAYRCGTITRSKSIGVFKM